MGLYLKLNSKIFFKKYKCKILKKMMFQMPFYQLINQKHLNLHLMNLNYLFKEKNNNKIKRIIMKIISKIKAI